MAIIVPGEGLLDATGTLVIPGVGLVEQTAAPSGSVTLTIDGVTYAATLTGPNEVSATIASLDEFDAAGIHVGTRWYTNIPVILTIDGETAEGTIQIVAPVPENFASVGVGPYEHAPDGITPGDDAYMDLLTGSGVATPETYSFEPAENSTFRSMGFNVTDGEWLAAFETSEDLIVPPPSEDDGYMLISPVIRNVVRYIA